MVELSGIEKDTKRALKDLEPQMEFMSEIAKETHNMEGVEGTLEHLLEVQEDLSEGFSDEEELKQKMRWIWNNSEHVRQHLVHLLELLEETDVDRLRDAVEAMNDEEERLKKQMKEVGFKHGLDWREAERMD
jgi:hypothetical protein